MNKFSSLITLGVIVVLIPLSGFPTMWKTSFSIAAGITIVIIANSARQEYLKRVKADYEEVAAHRSTYIENNERRNQTSN